MILPVQLLTCKLIFFLAIFYLNTQKTDIYKDILIKKALAVTFTKKRNENLI